MRFDIAMSKHVRAGLAGLLATASLALFAPAAQAAFGVRPKPALAKHGTCTYARMRILKPESRLLHAGRGAPPVRHHDVRTQSTAACSACRTEAALKRIRVDVPAWARGEPRGAPQVLAGAVRKRTPVPGNTKVGDDRTGSVRARRNRCAERTQRQGLQPRTAEPGLPLDFGIHVEAGAARSNAPVEQLFLRRTRRLERRLPRVLRNQQRARKAEVKLLRSRESEAQDADVETQLQRARGQATS